MWGMCSYIKYGEQELLNDLRGETVSFDISYYSNV
jgi:hypothetical protein